MAALPTHWKTQDGRVIAIVEMDDTHLLNSIRYQRRRMIENCAVFRKETQNPKPVYAGSKVWQLTIMLQRLTEALIALSHEAGKRNLTIDPEVIPLYKVPGDQVGEAVLPFTPTEVPQSLRANRNVNT